MAKKSILSINEFVEHIRTTYESNRTNSLIHTNLQLNESIEPGDFVEDSYGNKYKVYKTTKDFNIAAADANCEQISKFKDKDVLFVIVWANEQKESKFVFVHGIKDKYAVKRVNIKYSNDYIIESTYPILGDILNNDIYDVIYNDETYYIKPKPGDKHTVAYKDENLDDIVKINGKILVFSIKVLFGVSQWQTEWVAKID